MQRRKLAAVAVCALLALSIASAQHRLYVANAYFIPDASFVKLLADAARRGVDVRILTNGAQTDVKSTWLAGRSRYDALLTAGIRIYEYRPTAMHAISIDGKGNVWLGGNGIDDSQVLKFTRDGKFLLQVGKKGARHKAGAPKGEGQYGATADYEGNSNDPESFGKVAQIFVDRKTNEAFVADGYLNKRVAVLDADTGKFKRAWGAYGSKPVGRAFALLRGYRPRWSR